MNFVVLRYSGHPAFFNGSFEMLKRSNSRYVVQRPAEGVALVLGASSVEQLEALTQDWTLDPSAAEELSQKLGLDADDTDS